jgi:non-ribosomal peptide synthetase component F
MGLLAVYFLLLYKYTEQEDIIVGIASSGRNHADIENVIGAFINTLAIRGYPLGDKTFTHFLEEVKANALNAYDHQDYPFETLVDRLDVPRDFSRNPLLDVLFVSENVDAPELQVEGLTVSPYEFSGGISHLDLVLYTIEEGDAINMQLEYSTALFKQSTAERFFQRYIEILKQVVVKPRIKLKDIEISVELGETESGVTVDDFVDFDF